MQQRVDDVTGDRIRLSAVQRERQREQMIDQINAQTRQLNEQTKFINALTSRLGQLIDEHVKLTDGFIALQADYDGHIAWHRLPFFRRWLRVWR